MRTLVVTVNVEVNVPDDDQTSETVIAESVGAAVTAAKRQIAETVFEDPRTASRHGYSIGEVWADPNYWK